LSQENRYPAHYLNINNSTADRRIGVDPISIITAIAMIFGLLTADAVVNADTVAVQINVPASVARTGYTEDVAERIFTHEFETMNRHAHCCSRR